MFFYSGLAALCLMGKEKLCDTESLLLWTAKRQMRLDGGFQVRANQDDGGAVMFCFYSGSGYFSVSVSYR
jgi:prenyltransferase beta subunit